MATLFGLIQVICCMPELNLIADWKTATFRVGSATPWNDLGAVHFV